MDILGRVLGPDREMDLQLVSGAERFPVCQGPQHEFAPGVFPLEVAPGNREEVAPLFRG